jgi:hypothetical protein
VLPIGFPLQPLGLPGGGWEQVVAVRIKAHWHNDEVERSLDEIAGALAFICWRLAADKAIALHGADFVYESDEQRMAVIVEYLVFALQLVDRIGRERLGLSDEDRKALVIGLARRLAEHVQDNSTDLFGPGDYIRPFVAKLNERGTEYAEFGFTDEGPTYPFLRHLGYEIQQVMGREGENRWVIDQVMDQDGYEVYRQLSRAIGDLFG